MPQRQTPTAESRCLWNAPFAEPLAFTLSTHRALHLNSSGGCCFELWVTLAIGMVGGTAA
jgi:hypothetical protein